MKFLNSNYLKYLITTQFDEFFKFAVFFNRHYIYRYCLLM